MAKKTRILLLTRDPQLEEAFKAVLEGDRHHVVEVREISVLEPLLRRGAQLVAVDLQLSEAALRDGTTLLDQYQQVPVLALSPGTTADDRTERWYRHARGTPLEGEIDRAFDPEQLRQRVEELLSRGAFLQGGNLIGVSPAMRELRERILLIAPTPVSTVLITGESGTGKEEVANALHRYGRHKDQPLVTINCAAIPENLLESALFGHEKGAFTDAKSQHQGLFEQADGGTVFLDEIGEMTKAAQIRLLRVLEQREVTRVGGNAVIPVDVRIIAATNRDLQQAVAAGEFRLDLYHRLKVAELPIPPLRSRPEDIPPLIDHFVARFSADADGGTRFAGFSQMAMNMLMEYEWPGNVRELRNLVEHLIFLGPRRPVEPRDLLPHLEKPPVLERPLPVVASQSPNQSERELIYFALVDLRREVAELRRLIEEQLLRPAPTRPVPVYQLDEPRPLDESREVVDAGQIVEPPRTLNLKELEKEAIEQALQQVGGNRKQAAEILGLSPRTLYRKLDEYGFK